MQVSAEAKGHWMSGHSPFYFLETMSLTEPGIRLAGPASPRIVLLPPQLARAASVQSAFYVGAGNSSSGPHACCGHAYLQSHLPRPGFSCL